MPKQLHRVKVFVIQFWCKIPFKSHELSLRLDTGGCTSKIPISKQSLPPTPSSDRRSPVRAALPPPSPSISSMSLPPPPSPGLQLPSPSGTLKRNERSSGKAASPQLPPRPPPSTTSFPLPPGLANGDGTAQVRKTFSQKFSLSNMHRISHEISRSYLFFFN